MPTSLSPVDVANSALSKIGAQPINSLTDQTSASALACNLNFGLAYLEVSRASRWNCILTFQQLTADPAANPPVAPGGVTPITAVPWAPLTAYLANAFLTYGGYYYTVNFDYTSSSNFVNDLTAGFLVQTDQQAGTSVPDPFAGGDGSQFQSGWSFAYLLPDDFQLLVSLNENTSLGSWGGFGETSAEYEIIGDHLFCDETTAVVQYVKKEIDTTRFDSLFTHALTLKLASMISTLLRHDGGQMEALLLGEYKVALKEARTKNGGEKLARRFNPIASSNFNKARYGGANG